MNPIVTYWYIFFAGFLLVICTVLTLSFVCFTELFCFVIGQSDNFGFGFMTFTWNPLSKGNINEELILTASYPKDR